MCAEAKKFGYETVVIATRKIYSLGGLTIPYENYQEGLIQGIFEGKVKHRFSNKFHKTKPTKKNKKKIPKKQIHY